MRSILAIKKICVAFVCAGCFVAPARASEIIRSKSEITYDYGDVVKSTANDTFVICSDCKVDRLEKIRPVHGVAIRYAPLAVANKGQKGQSQALIAELSNEGAAALRGACSSNCVLATILFKFDSSILSASEKDKLDRIAASYVSQDVGFQISGYTCDVGTSEYNDRLSIRRANSVADYLRGKGFSNLQTIARGECCAASVTNKQLNRRVEITTKGKN